MKTYKELGLSYNPFIEGEVYDIEDFNQISPIQTRAIEEGISFADSTIGLPKNERGIKGHGLVLITGSKGLGKTTLLYSVKKFLDSKNYPNYYTRNLNNLAWDDLIKHKDKHADEIKNKELKRTTISNGGCFLLIDVPDTIEESQMKSFSFSLDNLVAQRCNVMIAINESQKAMFEAETKSLSFGKFHTITLPRFTYKGTRELIASRLKKVHIKNEDGISPFGENDISYIQQSSDGVPRQVIRTAWQVLFSLMSDENKTLPKATDNLLQNKIQNPLHQRQCKMIVEAMTSGGKDGYTIEEIHQNIGLDEITIYNLRRRLELLKACYVLDIDVLSDGKSYVYSLNKTLDKNNPNITYV